MTTAPGSFATRLRALRERAKLSAIELAEASGLSKQALNLLERGERQPTWATVQRLADAWACGRTRCEAGSELPAREV